MSWAEDEVDFEIVYSMQVKLAVHQKGSDLASGAPSSHSGEDQDQTCFESIIEALY